jgi:hypothetical protein
MDLTWTTSPGASLNTTRYALKGMWYTNSSISIWWSSSSWTMSQDHQQKNTMELLGHANPTGLNTARYNSGRCRRSNGCFSFWW